MEQEYIYTKKILIIDDEEELLSMVSLILRDHGFRDIYTAANAKEALDTFQKTNPDLILLDIMLPDNNGFTLIEEFKRICDIPIIFLTAKDTPTDKIRGVRLGADDYIVKPFFPDELALRVIQVLRRCYRDEDDIVKLKHASINLSNAIVYNQGREYQLTAKEYVLLSTLIRNANKIVGVDSLCEAIWGDNPFGYESSLQTHIGRIRGKIEQNPSKPESLVTIKGLGYRLLVPGR